jgi:hypothetical protein
LRQRLEHPGALVDGHRAKRGTAGLPGVLQDAFEFDPARRRLGHDRTGDGIVQGDGGTGAFDPLPWTKFFNFI